MPSLLNRTELSFVKSQTPFKKACLATAISASLFLSACSDSNDSASTSEVSGVIFASYVQGASVQVEDVSGNLVAGPTLSDENGRFSLAIPTSNLNGDLIFKALGGQYDDEASGEATQNGELSAFFSAGSLNENFEPQFSLSPESTIIERLVSEHRLSLANAHSTFASAFGYEHNAFVIPVDATESHESAENEQRLAGLRAATFSQLTQDLGLPAAAQSSLLNQLAKDIADGNFDGMEGSEGISIEDIQLDLDVKNQFAQALLNFRENRDLSGLNNAEIGALPFSAIATSENYIVRIVPSENGFKHGKSSFQFEITDKEGNPESGLSPMLMPMMHMAMHNHSTPKLAVTESDEAGTYDATVYFVMASMMASGDSMGYWQLKLSIGEETLNFFPKVMMSMNETLHTRLRGQDDLIPMMNGGSTNRPYELFREAMTSNENGTEFSVFISTRENMMSFPALTEGLALNEGSEFELTADNILVEMSVDQENWFEASDSGNGIWTAQINHESGDIPSQVIEAIYVRLTIAGEQKTDDGNPADGLADNAMFLLGSTPNMSMEM